MNFSTAKIPSIYIAVGLLGLAVFMGSVIPLIGAALTLVILGVLWLISPKEDIKAMEEAPIIDPADDYEPAGLPEEMQNIREILANSPDESLERIVNLGSEGFRPDAVLLARAELARRKLPLHPLPNICSNCKEELEYDAQFCPECRTPIVATHKTETEVACPDCAKMVMATAKYCKYCAAEIVLPLEITSARTATLARNVTDAELRLKAPAVAIMINAGIGVVTSLIVLMMQTPVYRSAQEPMVIAIVKTWSLMLLGGHVFCL